MTTYTPMIQQYLSIKAEVPDAFLFFRLGDFYEMFFEDATRCATELEITLTSRDGGGGERIPMCGVPHHSSGAYVQRLIEKGYKVAICEQVEDPATAKGVVRREVVRIVTPGTVIEDQMLAEKENNFLIVLAGDQKQWSLVATDLSTGECYATEFADDQQRWLDEAASYRPREVIVDPKLADQQEFLTQMKQRLSSLITVLEATTYLTEEKVEQALEQQFPHESIDNLPDAIKRGCGVLLHYLGQTQKRSLTHLRRLHRYYTEEHMVLDEAARRNLELTQTLRTGKRKGSLLDLLDHTGTSMGSRMLKKWLDKPLIDANEISARLDAVEALIAERLLLEEVREVLKKVYDLERLSSRLAYGSINARELLSLRRSLEQVPQIKALLLRVNSGLLAQLEAELDPCTEVSSLIAEAIEEEAPISVKDGGIIRVGFDDELDRLRDIQADGKGWLARFEQQERELTGIKSLKVRYNKVFGYFIEVTKSNLHLVPQERYQRKQTLSNAERYITPELKEREQLILDAQDRSTELEYERFVQVREQIAHHIAKLQQVAERIAQLDVLHSFAVIASRHHYVRPTLSIDGQFYIKEGRHPVVEAAVGGEVFVPNDLMMDDHNQLLLITGPNMAGKSTYMRQVALIAIMGQIGCFVPATSAQLPVLDRIFTRIGAADDLAGGQSTFMVEMAETCGALRQATPRSLILLDEVGRGTSTFDGMALAHAIVEYIHDRVGAKTLFSTHYHELTHLEQELAGVVNVHVRCVEKEGQVVFLHQVAPGRSDRSYGIQVAELAGLPEQVIQRAQVILDQLENDNEKESAASLQLDLFQLQENTVELTSVSEKCPVEASVLEELTSWNVMTEAPLATVQFLHELQQRLVKKE
ncbi:DNA mismatch repair protein MutS [Mechercharimyces sp. CAU 1602]|uniref:DNA mismatch repair protein MutS n=1 Tax=Mechercharimyces sp. CAU 1602 TaxID=2973933 RepID=UPI002163D0EF|nr:DNA mismatch repair protein MutS [Mechercharimyces sp. CAU 1602]MCS1351210.1 DNA mismatch repair protein MutS [Mechercharimyces sp. CAU 1602]